MQASVPTLRSKLYRPTTAADIVVRQALLSRLEVGRRLPLTLVSAPAGYGKTSLISHWLEMCEVPSAWLSLDETDADPAVFLRYLVAAVRTRFPEACHDTLELALMSDLPPLAELVGLAITSTSREGAAPRTTLVGVIRDQAALAGVLEILYGLHLPILRVEQVEGTETETKEQ